MGTEKMPEVLNGFKWELYNIVDDFSENYDLDARYPDKLRELQELFLVEAQKYQVFPLDNSILPCLLTPRPSATAVRTEFTYTGELSGLPDGSLPNILAKSYTISAEGEIPNVGGEGMLNTLGGRLYVDGKVADSRKIPHTIPSLMMIDESFDVGVDTRTGVDDND